MAEYRLEFTADTNAAGRNIKLLKDAIKGITKDFEQAEIGSEQFLESAKQISGLTKELKDARSAVVDLDKVYRDLNKTIAARQKAIMDFRAGMGARGAIPAVASPIRGGAAFPGSPGFYEAIEKAAAKAKNTASQISPPPQAFTTGSLAYYEQALRRLKEQARLIKPETKQWKELTQEIKKAERSIENINKRQRIGPSLRDRAGAAGGAFLYGGGLGGGLGSALGGVAGGLAAGVPGAFTGAAVGQLVDNLGKQAAGIARLSAEYNKSRIALAGVTSDQADFNKALNAASSIGQKFLLPLTDATRQFTKLQASVRGAGYDTETTVRAFNGIASAIIATGGSTEDLNGALLATTQVFSKGKVSAEELRQQIGERLAGAFTIFADSSGIASKELDKLLQKGEVTLDDFIKFLDELGKRYGSTAELLASAPENAGPRLQVAIQAMQLAYGGFFQKVGAGFQAYATDLVNFALNNQKTFQKIVATVVVVAQDIKTIFSDLINSLIPPLSSFFKFIFENFARGINALASLADQARRAPGGPERRARAAVEALYPNPLERALKGGQAFKEALNVELQYEKNASAQRLSREQRVATMADQLFSPYQPSQFGAALSNKPQAEMAEGADGGKAKGKERKSRFAQLTEELNLTRQLLAIDQQITIAELGGNQLAAIRLNGIKEQLRIQSEIAKVRLQEDVPGEEKQLQIAKLRLDAESERLRTNAAIQKQIQTELQGIQDAMVGIATTAKNELEDRQEYERLVKTGLAPAIAQITVEVRRQFAGEVEKLKMLEKQVIAEISILEAKQNQTQNDRDQLQILRERLALIQGGIADAPSLVGETIESRMQKQRLEEQPKSAMGFLTEAAAAAQQELDKLNNWGFQAVEGAKAIGSAFGQAFKDIASGSVSAQEALANMMQSIADHFLDMAAQIIAQQITMMIYGIILKALGVMGGAASGGGGFSSNAAGFGGSFDAGIPALPGIPDYSDAFKKAANGAVWKGGFEAFATGGVVSGPTLGLIGEGKYNEAIVPLPDGKSIPVQMQGDSIREKMNNSSAAPPSSPILSMTFESTTIGGVEYVSRDQLEQAMAETRRAASRDGAQRGMTMTLDRIQNSSSTRRRIGM
jgi:tape measure domain-containing protein